MSFEKKGDSFGVLLSTGADESFKMMNIYDIAGNVWEWTLEGYYYSNSTSTGVSRGGSYYNESRYYGSEKYNSAVFHGERDASAKEDGVGFRVCLF